MATDITALAVKLGPEFQRRYQLERALGAGGMAEVFRGRDIQLGRAVAVKIQFFDKNFAEASRERFHFEAQAGARVQDENVVRVYEYGEGRGCWWMACELVEGFSLADALESAGGRFTPVRALEAAVQIARGLKAIHEAGIVHRDLKPENVLIGSLDGVHKISDLGLAAAEGRGFQTEAGLVLGTPRYLAPEQVKGTTGPSADLYALGTLLYVMLSGAYPFPEKNELEIISQKLKLDMPARRLGELQPELEGPLDELVMRLLARDPAKRPGSAEELIPVFERLAVKAKDGRLQVRTGASRPGVAGPSAGRRVGSKGVSARTVVGSRPVVPGAGMTSGNTYSGVIAGGAGGLRGLAGSRGAAIALTAGLAVLLLAAAGLVVRARRGPATYSAEIRAGDWDNALQVVIPAGSGVPLKPARLVLPAGEPVHGAVVNGEQVFSVGLAHLQDLDVSMVVEMSERLQGEPERYLLTVDLDKARAAQADWDARVAEVARIAEGEGGLEPQGDERQNYTPERFEGSDPMPRGVEVQLERLVQRLPKAFAGSRGWDELASWMRSNAPLDKKLRLYRALGRWEVGGMEAGRQPRANPRKFPNDPPPRKAHPLLSVLRALIEVKVSFVHESVLGTPEVVTGVTNAANIRWIRNTRLGGVGRMSTIADVAGTFILTDIAKLMLEIVPKGPQAPRYSEKLRIAAFECARLAGRTTIDVEPTREADPTAEGRYGLRVAIIEFFPTSAVRLTVPLAAGAPLDFWLAQPEVREHRAACPQDCKAWRHTHVYTILMPHGLRIAETGKVGIRQGPIRPSSYGTRLPCEREEPKEGLDEREDIPESTYATLIVSDLAWIRVR